MTSGTKTIDNRHSLSTDCGTDPFVGFYSTKTWSGADDTSSHPKLPRNPPTAYVVKDKKGHDVIHWHRGTPMRPPKRARTRGLHAYSMSLYETNNTSCTWKFDPGTTYQAGTIHGCFGIPSIGGGWAAADDVKLILKLREKIQGSDFDASVFLGTAHQSLATITDAATRIAKALAQVKRGNIIRAAKLLGTGKPSPKKINAPRDIGSDWLALQYGWLPLLKDVHGAAEFLGFQLSFPFSKTYRAKISRKFDPNNYSMNGPLPIDMVNLAQGQIVALISEKPSVASMAGLTHPENLAWELLPWSFVVDWFIPIGDYLQARGFAQGLAGTFVTTKTIKKMIFGCYCNRNNQFKNLIVRGGEGYRYINVTVDRTVANSLAVPFPREKSLDKALSWRHCLNAVALLSQQIK